MNKEMMMTPTADAIVQAFEQRRLSRRELVAQLMALGAAMSCPSLAAAQGEKGEPTFAAQAIDHLALSVPDVKRSAAFYQKHLGLKLTRDGGENSAFLGCAGGDFLALFRGEKAGMHHFSFRIPNYDADDAVKRIEAAGLQPRREGNRVYFPDPDGLTVQVHQ